MKKRAKIIICMIMVVLILLVVGIPISNDLIAIKVEITLKDTPLPDNTEMIDSVSMAGKLIGSGNGMQYFGAILIKSGMSQQELFNYYSQYRNNDWEYLVEKQTTNQIVQIEHGTLSFNKIDSTSDTSDYYIVYSWGFNNNAILDMDLRGH